LLDGLLDSLDSQISASIEEGGRKRGRREREGIQAMNVK